MKRFLVFLLLACIYSINAFALPNPASVNCINTGNQLFLIKSAGICVFPDGSYCEEWAFFKKLCTKGQNQFPGGVLDRDNMGQYCLVQKDGMTLVIVCGEDKDVE